MARSAPPATCQKERLALHKSTASRVDRFVPDEARNQEAIRGNSRSSQVIGGHHRWSSSVVIIGGNQRWSSAASRGKRRSKLRASTYSASMQTGFLPQMVHLPPVARKVSRCRCEGGGWVRVRVRVRVGVRQWVGVRQFGFGFGFGLGSRSRCEPSHEMQVSRHQWQSAGAIGGVHQKTQSSATIISTHQQSPAHQPRS